jgi:hypothetical protein
LLFIARCALEVLVVSDYILVIQSVKRQCFLFCRIGAGVVI